jgi:hypothetical protein
LSGWKARPTLTAAIPGRHLVGLESPTYSKGKFQEGMEFEFKAGFILTPEF